MFQDDTQLDRHLERTAPLPMSIPSPDDEIGQRKRMLVALGILLVALVAVVLKDWDFWFPPSPEVQEATVHKRAPIAPVAPLAEPPAPARERKTQKIEAPPASTTAPMAATTERAALPPLEIEVVAGNRHINVPAKSNAIHVDVDSGVASAAAPASSAMSVPATVARSAVNAGDRVQLSPLTAQNVTVSVPPNYPMLARQMKVQGAVSLQALISREGSIQEIQILSGPAILAAAAREAVKQWHFKPYLLKGQPVETEARITVNFTISTN
jgi:protein TonB